MARTCGHLNSPLCPRERMTRWLLSNSSRATRSMPSIPAQFPAQPILLRCNQDVRSRTSSKSVAIGNRTMTRSPDRVAPLMFSSTIEPPRQSTTRFTIECAIGGPSKCWLTPPSRRRSKSLTPGCPLLARTCRSITSALCVARLIGHPGDPTGGPSLTHSRSRVVAVIVGTRTARHLICSPHERCGRFACRRS